MTKLNRQALKAVMKEILVEIMMEGLDNDGTLVENRSKRNHNNTRNEIPMQNRVIEKPVVSKRQNTSNNRIEDAVKEVSNDPFMMELLRDTANTTLLEQATQSHGLGDAAQQVVSNMEVEQFPGANNWAHLAFNGSDK